MALRDTVRLPEACENHSRGVHGSWSSTPGGSEWFRADGEHHRRCRFKTSTHHGSSNFDFNSGSFNPHADAPHQPHCDFECSSNAFDETWTDEPRFHRQASRRIACIHWGAQR